MNENNIYTKVNGSLNAQRWLALRYRYVNLLLLLFSSASVRLLFFDSILYICHNKLKLINSLPRVYVCELVLVAHALQRNFIYIYNRYTRITTPNNWGAFSFFRLSLSIVCTVVRKCRIRSMRALISIGFVDSRMLFGWWKHSRNFGVALETYGQKPSVVLHIYILSIYAYLCICMELDVYEAQKFLPKKKRNKNIYNVMCFGAMCPRSRSKHLRTHEKPTQQKIKYALWIRCSPFANIRYRCSSFRFFFLFFCQLDSLESCT